MLFISLERESSDWQGNSSFTWCTKKKSPEGAEHTLFSHGWRHIPGVSSSVFKSFCNPKKEILDSLGRCYWESLLHAVACWSDAAGSHFQCMCSSGRRNDWAGETPVALRGSTGGTKGLVKDCRGSPCLAWMVQVTAAHIICFPVLSQGYSEPRCWDAVWRISPHHARWAWCSVVPSPTPASQWDYHEKLTQALQVTWDASQPDQVPGGDRSCG